MILSMQVDFFSLEHEFLTSIDEDELEDPLFYDGISIAKEGTLQLDVEDDSGNVIFTLKDDECIFSNKHFDTYKEVEEYVTKSEENYDTELVSIDREPKAGEFILYHQEDLKCATGLINIKFNGEISKETIKVVLKRIKYKDARKDICGIHPVFDLYIDGKYFDSILINLDSKLYESSLECYDSDGEEVELPEM